MFNRGTVKLNINPIKLIEVYGGYHIRHKEGFGFYIFINNKGTNIRATREIYASVLECKFIIDNYLDAINMKIESMRDILS